jgi:hypothetical protein
LSEIISRSWKEKLVKLCFPYYLSNTLNAASPKLTYWSGQRSSKEMRYHNSETARKGGCQKETKQIPGIYFSTVNYCGGIWEFSLK